jgi:hypothetical protein
MGKPISICTNKEKRKRKFQELRKEQAKLNQ